MSSLCGAAAEDDKEQNYMQTTFNDRVYMLYVFCKELLESTALGQSAR